MKDKITSKRHADFRHIINTNRKVLRDNGFRDASVSRWASGSRIPSQAMAIRMASVLNISIDKIPYHIRLLSF